MTARYLADKSALARMDSPLVAAKLGPIYGPMVVFAAATGLRPSELFALEQRDIDRALGVVYVRRAYANGQLKHTKTRLSTRAVPLQAVALAALDRLPPSENSLLFPNARGELWCEVLEGWWSDAGTFASLHRAGNLVARTGANRVDGPATRLPPGAPARGSRRPRTARKPR